MRRLRDQVRREAGDRLLGDHRPWIVPRRLRGRPSRRLWKRDLATTACWTGGPGPRPAVHVRTPCPRRSPSWCRWPQGVTHAGLMRLMALRLSSRRRHVSPRGPVGLHRRHRVSTPLERGLMVGIPVPVSAQAWHSWWLPWLKPVAGLAGDHVCLSDEGLWIDGRGDGPVRMEAAGRPWPRRRGCWTVGPSDVMLASDGPRSLDAREVGPVATA
jgi:type IV secretory pathway protease TraF